MSVSATIEATRRSGEQLLEVVKKDRPKIDPRLEPGTIDGMDSDLDRLQDEFAGTTAVRQAKKAAKMTQDAAAVSLAGFVQAVRNAVRLKKSDVDLAALVGVGKVMKVTVVQSVVDGAEMVVKANETRPDLLRKVGVLPADIERIVALRAQLASVDKAQEAVKVTSKEKTQSRNAAHKRVQEAIASIIAAAELAFVDNPERLALYRAVLPKSPTAKKSPTPVA